MGKLQKRQDKLKARKKRSKLKLARKRKKLREAAKIDKELSKLKWENREKLDPIVNN